MVLFKKCFCCKVAQMWSYIVGLCQLLYHSTVMTACMITANNIAQSTAPQTRLFTSASVMLVFTAGMTVTGAILLIGVFMRRKYYIIPFLICSFCCLVYDLSLWFFLAVGNLSSGIDDHYIFTMTDIFLNFLNTATENGVHSYEYKPESTSFIFLLTDLVVVALNTYILLYIFSYYQTLEENAIMRRTERRVTVHRDEISGASLNSIQFSPNISFEGVGTSDTDLSLPPPQYPPPPPPVLDCNQNPTIRSSATVQLDVLNNDESFLSNQNSQRNSFESTESLLSDNDSFFETGINNENKISSFKDTIDTIVRKSQKTPEPTREMKQLYIEELKDTKATKINESPKRINVIFEAVLITDHPSKPKQYLTTKKSIYPPPLPPRQPSNSKPSNKVSTAEKSLPFPPPLPPHTYDKTVTNLAPLRPYTRSNKKSTVIRKQLIKQTSIASNRIHSPILESILRSSSQQDNTRSHLMRLDGIDIFDIPKQVAGESMHLSDGHSVTEDISKINCKSNIVLDLRRYNVDHHHNTVLPSTTNSFRRSKVIPSLTKAPKSLAISTFLRRKLSSPSSPPRKIAWPLEDSQSFKDDYVTLVLPVNIVNSPESSHPLSNICNSGARPKHPVVGKPRSRKVEGTRMQANESSGKLGSTPRPTSLGINQDNCKETSSSKPRGEGSHPRRYQTGCDNLFFENDDSLVNIEGAVGGQPLIETSTQAQVISGSLRSLEDDSIFFPCYISKNKPNTLHFREIRPNTCNIPEREPNPRVLLPTRKSSPWIPERIIKAMTEEFEIFRKDKKKKKSSKDKNRNAKK